MYFNSCFKIGVNGSIPLAIIDFTSHFSKKSVPLFFSFWQNISRILNIKILKCNSLFYFVETGDTERETVNVHAHGPSR